jgi:hypothetical protein
MLLRVPAGFLKRDGFGRDEGVASPRKADHESIADGIRGDVRQRLWVEPNVNRI